MKQPFIKKITMCLLLSGMNNFTYSMENQYKVGDWDNDSVSSHGVSMVASSIGNSTFKETSLVDLKDLRKCFFKGWLEITPNNYECLLQYSEIHETAFNNYDRGVFIKQWKASSGTDKLLDLLFKFTHITKFKLDVMWDQEGIDMAETISRSVQFFPSLSELTIAKCRLTDSSMIDVMESIERPTALKILDVRDNAISEGILVRIREYFTNLIDFKTNLANEIDNSTLTVIVQPSEKVIFSDQPQTVPTEEWLAAERIRRRPEFDQMLVKSGINARHGSSIIQDKLISIYENETMYIDPQFANRERRVKRAFAEKKETDTLFLCPMHFFPKGSTLPLSASPLNGAMLKALPEALKMNTKIKHIHLSDFILDPTHWRHHHIYHHIYNESLPEAITCNQTIQTLQLTGIKGADDLVSDFLVPIINSNKSIHTIRVHNADALGNSKEASTHTIHGIQSLQKGGLAASLLANALQYDKIILKFNIANNAIGNTGAMSFAQMLSINYTLEELDLFGNWITDIGVEALARALYSNNTLRVLNLGGNEIKEKGKEAIEKMKIVNTSVRVLI